jgi:hypothetical protein
MYLCRNLRWKSLRMVSLMNRFGVLVSPRAWFLNTTSSSHLQTTHAEHDQAHRKSLVIFYNIA